MDSSLTEEMATDRPVECHLHRTVPVDVRRMEAMLELLVVNDANAQLALRGRGH